MSNAAIEAGRYQAPTGFEDFAERLAGDKKLILYIAEKAFVDVVKVDIVDGEEVVGPHLRRIEGSTEQAMDLLNHPSLFIPRAEADELFGDQRPAVES